MSVSVTKPTASFPSTTTPRERPKRPRSRIAYLIYMSALTVSTGFDMIS